jgi:hypothetical protein
LLIDAAVGGVMRCVKQQSIHCQLTGNLKVAYI